MGLLSRVCGRGKSSWEPSDYISFQNPALINVLIQ